MIRLNNDYNEIACSEVMAALQETTPCSYPGYGQTNGAKKPPRPFWHSWAARMPRCSL